MLKIFFSRVLIVAFFFSMLKGSRADTPMTNSDSNAMLVQFLTSSLHSLESIEIAYSSEIFYSDRIKELDPAISSEKDTYLYKQKGSTWSYDVTKALNSGKVRKFRYYSDGEVYKYLVSKTRSLTITRSSSVKNQPRWWNPLFEGFSFLYETQYYSNQRSPALNQVDPFSPMLCDLSDIANGKALLPPLVSSSVVTEPSGKTTLSFGTTLPGDTSQQLSNFKLYFDSPSQLLPNKMEKRDAAGAMIIELEASDYEMYGHFQFPKGILIKRYLNGKVDTTVKVRVDSLKINDPTIVVNDIDPSEASNIYDQINGVNIQPGIFK